MSTGRRGWQFLDNRELPDGSTVVYHWPLEYVERFCFRTGQPMHPDADRCRADVLSARPCEVWHRQPPECPHEHLVPNRPQPQCETCGLVGEDVTHQLTNLSASIPREDTP